MEKINMRQILLLLCTKAPILNIWMKLLKNTLYWNSSAFDINIVENLMANGKINKSTYVYVTVLKGTNTLKIFHV
jgi:hypothetical protein